MFPGPLKGKVDKFFDSVKDQLGGIFWVVTSLWGVLAFNVLLRFVGGDLREWLALRPRQLAGLHGIVTMPLVHADVLHLAYNTWGLVIALGLLAMLRPQSWRKVLLWVLVISGALTWGFGGGAKIVGASGVVMGLICFLIAPGALVVGWWGLQKVRKSTGPCPIQVHFVPLVVSLLLGVFYFQNLFSNLVPIPGMNMTGRTSWSAHWCGAIAGVIVAFLFHRAEEESGSAEKSLVEESLL